jgi:hypothetical protein
VLDLTSPAALLRDGTCGPITLDGFGDLLFRAEDEAEIYVEVRTGRTPAYIQLTTEGIDCWVVELSGDEEIDYRRGYAMALELLDYIEGHGRPDADTGRYTRAIAYRLVQEDLQRKSHGGVQAMHKGFWVAIMDNLACRWRD